jgi:phosphotransferase system IIA component
LKKVGATNIWINHTNYKHEFQGKGETHGSGSAFDINSITVNGKEITAYNKEGKQMEYPKELKSFDIAFMNQLGVKKCWTPYVVYDGPGNTLRDNMTLEWLKSVKDKPEWATMTAKQKKESFMKYLKEVKGIEVGKPLDELMVSEFGHIDHNHYDVNTHYSDYREWK